MKKYILLVEDNPDDVALTIRAFKKNNITIEIIVVRDGEEALEFIFSTGKYANRRPANFPELILLDLKIPKVSGLEVLKKIRESPITKIIPVTVLTSSKEDEDLIESYKIGANSYIRKPVDFNEFLTAVGHLGLFWFKLNESPAKGGSYIP